MNATFLSDLLDEYGRPRDRYAGRGELSNEREAAGVEWAAAQYDDGRVLLAYQGGETAWRVFVEGLP
jgi:hypothetical protein